MTQGRFDCTANCRPSGFDSRTFWATRHHADCDKDHRYRESCPFHDLRASGCFQPEEEGIGGDGAQITPTKLTSRPAGKSMKTHIETAKSIGCGGTIILEETEPLPIINNKRSGGPWCSSRSKGGFFSHPPYVAVPPEDDHHRAKTSYIPFRTVQKGGLLHKAFPYIPQGTLKAIVPHKSRLSSGIAKHSRPKQVLSDGEEEYHNVHHHRTTKSLPPRKKINVSPRQPLFDNKSLLGTFGRVTEHLPDPFPTTQISETRRPFLTWHTHSKRSPPIAVPWTRGVQYGGNTMMTSPRPLHGTLVAL